MNEEKRSKAEFRQRNRRKCYQGKRRKVVKEVEPGRNTESKGILEMERQKRNSGKQ